MTQFQFRNLDESTRWAMLREIDMDQRNNAIYVSKRLTEEGQKRFNAFLGEAAIKFDPGWLAAAMKQSKFWHEYEKKHHQTQGIINSKIPSNAPDVLADNEFNRYYMRAVCVQAIEKGINNVTVYRARETSRHRPEHDEIIGKEFDAAKLLHDLRDPQTQLIKDWGGLSVCF